MGWLQTMGKRVALRVSALVAKNELFERYGERPVQPPLEPGRWAGSSEDAEASPEDGSSDDDDDEEEKREIPSGCRMTASRWMT